MNKAIPLINPAILVTLFSLVGLCGYAQDLTIPKAEKELITKEVKRMSQALNKGEIDFLISKTHPVVFTSINKTPQEFKALIEKVSKDMDMEVISLTVDQPGQLFKAGDQSICFVQLEMVMKSNGRKAKLNSFMVAVKTLEGEWKYLDGVGIHANPKTLWKFFPGLDRSVKMPEFKVKNL